MSNMFNKKISEMLSKMDEKVMQTKLNAALDMLMKGNTEELAKKINSIDKDELISKINNFDESKIQDLNININEIKNKISNEDLEKLSNLIGGNGDELVKKIKDIIK